MTWRRGSILLMLGLTACMHPPVTVAPTPEPPGPDRAAVAKVVSSAADQIRGCYRSPKLNRAARQIVTVLRVSYTIDGILASSPTVLRQSGVTKDNAAYAGQMGRGAIEAVERCVPLRLSPELYKGGWDEFDLTFSPRGLA